MSKKQKMKKIGFMFAVIASALLARVAISGDPLEKIEQTYRATQTLSAEFVQSTYVALTEKTVRRNGRLFYQKGGKIRIEYAGSRMTHYISDGKTLWVKDPASGEIQTYELKDSGLPEEALKFLTELGELRRYFKVSMTKPFGDFVTWDLEPKKKSTYRHLLCVFDEDFYLKELTLYSHSGNKSEYKFFNRKTGEKFQPELFRP